MWANPTHSPQHSVYLLTSGAVGPVVLAPSSDRSAYVDKHCCEYSRQLD